MSIIVRRSDNGWVIEDSTGEDRVRYHGFEYSDDSEKSEVFAFKRLLWKIDELVGPQTSRHSKYRIRVAIVRGDKWVDVSTADAQKSTP